MERFKKENYENIKSLFEEGTGVRLPSRRYSGGRLRYAAAMAAVLAVAVTGAYISGLFSPKEMMKGAAPESAEDARIEAESLSEPKMAFRYTDQTEPQGSNDAAQAEADGSVNDHAEAEAGSSAEPLPQAEAEAKDNSTSGDVKTFAAGDEAAEESEIDGYEVVYTKAAAPELFGFYKENEGVPCVNSGIDIAVGEGTPVPAAAAGRIAETGQSDVLGKYIVIEHDGGFTSVYGCLKEIEVSAGEEVQPGLEIALSGSGESSGEHLHFELLQHGEPAAI